MSTLSATSRALAAPTARGARRASAGASASARRADDLAARRRVASALGAGDGWRAHATKTRRRVLSLGAASASSGLIMPGDRGYDASLPAEASSALTILDNYSPGSAATPGGSYNEHKPKTPPPDLPSLLLDSRIVYIGMPLVPAVTELIVSELLYMQYTDASKPCYIYINSTGCQRADGEVVGFETEATSIYDTMKYIGNPIYTVGTGVAIGQACMILSAGDKGKRFMTTHATAMLHQPRVPSTGQRQAIELHIKWKEVLAQKRAMVDILASTTGHSKEKIDKDIQRPLYMTAGDAIAYGIIDKVVDKSAQAIDSVMSNDAWDSEAGLVKQTRPAPPGSR